MADVRARLDDRGVSTVLGYTLNVVVATLVVTGLLVAAGSLVDSQRQQAVRSELSVVGQRLAANMEVADRLSQAAGDGTVRVHVKLPERVSGSPYHVAIQVRNGNATAVLTADDPAVRVEVPIDNQTAVARTTAPGGSVDVTWSAGGSLEVHRG